MRTPRRPNKPLKPKAPKAVFERVQDLYLDDAEIRPSAVARKTLTVEEFLEEINKSILNYVSGFKESILCDNPGATDFVISSNRYGFHLSYKIPNTKYNEEKLKYADALKVYKQKEKLYQENLAIYEVEFAKFDAKKKLKEADKYSKDWSKYVAKMTEYVKNNSVDLFSLPEALQKEIQKNLCC